MQLNEILCRRKRKAILGRYPEKKKNRLEILSILSTRDIIAPSMKKKVRLRGINDWLIMRIEVKDLSLVRLGKEVGGNPVSKVKRKLMSMKGKILY